MANQASARRFAPLVAVLVIGTLCFCTALCQAKGSFGGVRASSGGYFRSSKTGYYSSRTRYYTTNMYWGRGYAYSSYRNNYHGPSIRTSLSQPDAAQLTGLVCKRKVIVDSTVPNFARSITWNSTQRCVKEVVQIPGDPSNLPFEQLMLDRFRFTVSNDPYPTVDLVVFPDKDITVPTVNTTLRARRLIVSSPTNPTPLAEVDFSSLTWQPCTLNTCAAPSATSNIGRPSSRFLDGGRVFTNAIRATWNSTVVITLRFWLSEDFDEDGWWNHIFLFPSLLKWDFQVEVPSAAAFASMFPGLTSNSVFRVELALAAPAPGSLGSQLTPIPVATDRLATNYNPKEMNRIEIGTFTDQQNSNAALLSWWSAVDPQVLCFTPGQGTTCASFDPGFSASALPGLIACRSTDAVGSLPPYCQNFLRNNQVGYLLSWTFQPLIAPPYVAQWYVDFGYFDPNEGTQAIPASAPAVKGALLSVCVALLAVVCVW